MGFWTRVSLFCFHPSVSYQKLILETWPTRQSAINNCTLPVRSEGIRGNRRMSGMAEMDRKWPELAEGDSI